jgi:energy-coupling factor transport system ATP-binding protein
MSIIEVRNLTYIYCKGMTYEKKALDDITLSINQGEFLGIIGANGSGKTTLAQHFNGLLSPTSGEVVVCGKKLSEKQNRNDLWKKVGFVFQYPEQQFFEETVFEEVSYGLRNLGINLSEIEKKTENVLELVGLDPKSVAKLFPLNLSRGMRRRVALASVLVMQPEILILDEPTAALDTVGRDSILQLIKKLQVENQTTIIMISHNLREMISLSDRIAVLEAGRLVAYGTARQVLNQQCVHDMYGIGVPDYLRLLYKLRKQGMKIDTQICTFDEVEEELAQQLKWRRQ